MDAIRAKGLGFIRAMIGQRVTYMDKVVHVVMPDGSHRRIDKPSRRGWTL